MHIDQIRVEHVAMPLLSPWRTAYGEDSCVESVLVQMSSGSVDAWGEVSPLAAPCYSPEWAGGVFACVRDWLAPAIVGCDISSGQDLQQRLALFKGNPFAKGALDVTWWSLEAQLKQVPLHLLLGASRNAAPVGADFGVQDNVADLLREIESAFACGFPRVKLKFRPGWDLAMLDAVRREFPDQVFHIDCNAGYRLSDLDLFRRLDDYSLAMIEQPLQADGLWDHAKLQKELSTPICLDESITSPDRARLAIELGSCRFINIKPGRVGGLTPAVEIHDLCRDAGIACWVGGMLESAVGAGICGALAMLENFTYPADVFPSSRFYAEDLADPPLELQWIAGVPHVSCNDEVGIGTAPDEGRLARCRVQTVTLSD